MGANRNVMLARQRHCCAHCLRVAGVHTTGDVGRGDERDEVGVLPNAFADVGIEVDSKCTIPKHACNFSLILVTASGR